MLRFIFIFIVVSQSAFALELNSFYCDEVMSVAESIDNLQCSVVDEIENELPCSEREAEVVCFSNEDENNLQIRIGRLYKSDEVSEKNESESEFEERFESLLELKCSSNRFGVKSCTTRERKNLPMNATAIQNSNYNKLINEFSMRVVELFHTK